LAVGAGVKLPTGSSDKSFMTPIGLKEADETQPMQLGSGSFDLYSRDGSDKGFLPKFNESMLISCTLYQPKGGSLHYEVGEIGPGVKLVG